MPFYFGFSLGGRRRRSDNPISTFGRPLSERMDSKSSSPLAPHPLVAAKGDCPTGRVRRFQFWEDFSAHRRLLRGGWASLECWRERPLTSLVVPLRMVQPLSAARWAAAEARSVEIDSLGVNFEKPSDPQHAFRRNLSFAVELRLDQQDRRQIKVALAHSGENLCELFKTVSFPEARSSEVAQNRVVACHIRLIEGN